MTTATQNTLSLPATFAQNLLVARTAANLTQHALAHAAGVSRATIAQLESGLGDPKLSTVQQLAEALNVSPSLLLFAKPDLHALANLTTRSLENPGLRSPALATMQHLVTTGLRGRLEATQIGITLAKNAGFSPHPGPHQIGAAIGSFHLPGRGTFAAAHFAQLFSTDAPA